MMKQVNSRSNNICFGNFLKILIILLLSVPSTVQPITIGSDTDVTFFNTQQVLADGDRIAFGALLKAGFKLTDETTTGTFDSCFPVAGDIELNGGTLVLNKDLILREISDIVNLGNITGNDHSLQLSKSTGCIPSQFDCSVEFVQSVSQGTRDVETTDWSSDGKFVAIGLRKNTNKILKIYEMDDTALMPLSLTDEKDIGDAEVTVVRWHPSRPLLAVGRLRNPSGPELHIFSLDTNDGTITQISSDEINASVFALAWHPDGGHVIVGTGVNGSTMMIYPINGDGTLNIASKVDVPIDINQIIKTQAMDFDKSGRFLAVGLSKDNSEDELQIFEFEKFPTLDLVFKKGMSFNTEVRAVDWNPKLTDLLAVGLSVGAGSGDLLRIVQYDSIGNTITEIESTNDISAGSIRSIDWNPTGCCFAVGGSAVGGRGEFYIYEYDKETSFIVLPPVSEFEFGDEVESVRWRPDGKFIITGNDRESSIGLAAKLSLYKLFDPDCFVFSDLKIQLDCDVELKQCCIEFQGDSLINGNGFRLILSDFCQIKVRSDSTLLIKDVKFEGLDNKNIQLTDETSKLIFENADIVLDGDFILDQGNFDVIGDLNIIGKGKTFTYATDQISTIQSNSSLILNPGVTFKYDPPGKDPNLLKFEDSTSKLAVCNARLESGDLQWQFTKGELFIKGRSTIASNFVFKTRSTRQGGTDECGIIFGDGVNPDLDTEIHLEEGAVLVIESGQVCYSDISFFGG